MIGLPPILKFANPKLAKEVSEKVFAGKAVGVQPAEVRTGRQTDLHRTDRLLGHHRTFRWFRCSRPEDNSCHERRWKTLVSVTCLWMRILTDVLPSTVLSTVQSNGSQTECMPIISLVGFRARPPRDADPVFDTDGWLSQ